MNLTVTRGATFALALGLLAASPRFAYACGGLFCSSVNPVNQAAERVVFSFDKTRKKVTAVVEILYQGPSQKFAWVLPVPSIPTVEVSTSAMLDRLQAATNPSYGLQRDWSQSACKSSDLPPTLSPGGGSGGSSGAAVDAGSAGPTVSVLASGTAGPYDYEVLKVDAAMADPAQVAIDWLKANQYDVGALGPDVLRPYLQLKMNLLAFRLSKNKST